ncbi:transglycosylase family protein [Acidimicrobium ferrooxidans]|nr:transglycosylase family protein [Acidimicrobium ferrooxidans]
MTEAHGWAQWRRAAATLALLVSGGFVARWGSTAPSSSVQSLQAQAQVIEAQLANLGASVHAITVQIQETQAAIAANEASEAILEGQLRAEHAAIARSRRVLVTAADQQFVTAGQYSSVLASLRSNYSSVGLTQGYEQVASSSITQALSAYEQAGLEIEVTQAALAARVRATEAELVQDQAQRAQLSQRVAATEAELAQVHSQLASAIAAEAAAPLPAPGGAAQAVQVLLAPPPPSPTSLSGPATAAQLLALRDCESGGNYQADTGNGYYGAYQFAASTWAALGYGGLPNQAPPAVQDQAAEQLLARAGWGQWPVCSVLIGM